MQDGILEKIFEFHTKVVKKLDFFLDFLKEKEYNDVCLIIGNH